MDVHFLTLKLWKDSDSCCQFSNTIKFNKAFKINFTNFYLPQIINGRSLLYCMYIFMCVAFYIVKLGLLKSQIIRKGV